MGDKHLCAAPLQRIRGPAEGREWLRGHCSPSRVTVGVSEGGPRRGEIGWRIARSELRILPARGNEKVEKKVYESRNTASIVAYYRGRDETER